MRVSREAQGDSALPSVASILQGIHQELSSLKHGWSAQLQRDPSCFGAVEVDVHHTFQRLADQVVAGLLGEVGQQPALEEAGKKSR